MLTSQAMTACALVRLATSGLLTTRTRVVLPMRLASFANWVRPGQSSAAKGRVTGYAASSLSTTASIKNAPRCNQVLASQCTCGGSRGKAAYVTQNPVSGTQSEKCQINDR